MITPQLSARLRADWLAATLRADEIRRDTLVALVQTWSDPDARDAVIDALDELAKAVASPRDGEGAEVDACIDDVEALAEMDTPQIELDRAAAERLHAELGAALAVMGRPRVVPVERGAA